MQNPPILSRRLTLMLAAASGVAVANIYYNQPMLADMAATFHVPAQQDRLCRDRNPDRLRRRDVPPSISLGDFLERRRLIVSLFLATSLALAGAALLP